MSGQSTLRPPAGLIPHTEPSFVSAPFWEGCMQEELRFQRCLTCNATQFPPAEHCRVCLSASLEWQRSSGQGSLYSWSIVWRPMSPAFEVPYAPAIIDLDEGFRIVSALIDLEPSEITAGMRLTVTFHRAGDFVLPYFVASN